MKQRLRDIIEFIKGTADEHMGAFAAQSAFFLFLSIFPLINIVVMLPSFLPVSEDQVLNIIYFVLPSRFEEYIAGIVKEMYDHPPTSITIISFGVALWSAAKGFMSVKNGLNEIYRSREQRNYLLIRGVSALYTLVFIILIVALIPINMFGTQIAMLVLDFFPDMTDVTMLVYSLRSTATFLILFVMFELLYTIVPNKKLKFRKQVPGALFAAFAWVVGTKVFSIYIDYYASKQFMYGSLTTVVLFMFWLYFVIYMVFVGAQINEYMHVKRKRDEDYELKKYSKKKKEVWEDDDIDERVATGARDD